MCRISGAARYEIGRGGGGREKRKKSGQGRMQNRYIIEDDAVTIIERWFPSEGKKKKFLFFSSRFSRSSSPISSFRFVLAKRTSF